MPGKGGADNVPLIEWREGQERETSMNLTAWTCVALYVSKRQGTVEQKQRQ